MGSNELHPSSSFTPTVEIRAGKTANRFGVLFYSIALIGLPWLGWVAFGPGTPGDTTVNGNSILAFWFMRIILLCGWIGCLIGLKHSLVLLKHLPILFTLNEAGIKDRNWIETPWAEIEDAFYIRGDLYLKVNRRVAKKEIIFKTEEIGFRSFDEIVTYMKNHAPTHIIKKL